VTCRYAQKLAEGSILAPSVERIKAVEARLKDSCTSCLARQRLALTKVALHYGFLIDEKASEAARTEEGGTVEAFGGVVVGRDAGIAVWARLMAMFAPRPKNSADSICVGEQYVVLEDQPGSSEPAPRSDTLGTVANGTLVHAQVSEETPCLVSSPNGLFEFQESRHLRIQRAQMRHDHLCTLDTQEAAFLKRRARMRASIVSVPDATTEAGRATELREGRECWLSLCRQVGRQPTDRKRLLRRTDGTESVWLSGYWEGSASASVALREFT
jgi:hypothetical protein